jgi:hypothetical protein
MGFDASSAQLQEQPISTAFVESAVNEIVAKRMNKKQRMRWNRMTVQSFLDVRTAVLNDTLEDAFRIVIQVFGPPTMIKLDQWPVMSPRIFACSHVTRTKANRRSDDDRRGAASPVSGNPCLRRSPRSTCSTACWSLDARYVRIA